MRKSSGDHDIYHRRLEIAFKNIAVDKYDGSIN